MERNKTIDIVISFIIALVLWFYVINIVNPPQSVSFKNVPVVVSGEETLADRGLAIAGGEQYSVNVKVTGTRKDVSSLTAADIAATADIGSLAKGNAYITVTVTVPRNFTLDQVDEESIEVLVEDLVTQPVNVALVPKDAGDGLETTVLSVGSESVSVKGAKSDVERVKSVRTEISPDILEVDKIKTVSVQGVPVDSNGLAVKGVSLVTEYISYEAGVFHTKNVHLDIPVSGVSLYGPEGIAKIEAPTAITIKGSEETLAGVSVIQTEPIDVTGISVNKGYLLTPVLPEGVYISKTAGSLNAVVQISEEAKAAYEAALAAEAENETSGSAIESNGVH